MLCGLEGVKAPTGIGKNGVPPTTESDWQEGGIKRKVDRTGQKHICQPRLSRTAEARMSLTEDTDDWQAQ